jgi:Alginate export
MRSDNHLSRWLTSFLFVPVFVIGMNAPTRANIDLISIAGEPVTLNVWMRTREYVWSYFQPGTINKQTYENRYNYQDNTLRFGLGYQINGVKFYIEAMNPTFFDLPSHAIAPAPSGNLGLGANYYAVHQKGLDSNIFLKQGYIAFGQQILEHLYIKGGRFEFDEGQDLVPEDAQLKWIVLNQISQRLIGNFGFSDVMRSFDGAMVRYGEPNWNLTAMYGVPTRGVFDNDGMDEIRKVDVIYGALNGLLERASGNLLGRAFFIWYDDNRGLAPVDNQPVAAAAANHSAISIESPGADAAATYHLGPGTADAMVWGTYQFGNWGDQIQSGWATAAQIGYRFGDLPWQPWPRAGFQMSSGDSTPNNNVHSTFFQILPTPRVYALNPVYNMMNNLDASTELVLNPLSNVEWRSTFHSLWLSSSKDLWYYGGGAFDNHIFGYIGRPSFGKSYLGSELDTGITWKLRRYLQLYFFTGHLFGGSVVAANFPSGRGETFGYAESTFSF